MKKWFFLLPGLAIWLVSCKKSDNCSYQESNAVATASEISYLQNHMSTNSIPAIQHPSGIFYTLDFDGNSDRATICSNITVYYVGSLLQNGNIFESSASTAGTNLALGQLIIGLQKGIPVVRKGGQITVYIPPSLGYGAVDRYDTQGNLSIPANSYIKFVLQLLDVQ